MEFKKVEIKDGMFVPFTSFTKRLGRAEFSICPQYKRGQLVKLSIYPLQQEDVSSYYEWEGTGKKYFTIQGYEGLDEPKAWRHSWCKEHKCQIMRVYVPKDSNFIWFSIYSDNISIGFTKRSW